VERHDFLRIALSFPEALVTEHHSSGLRWKSRQLPAVCSNSGILRATVKSLIQEVAMDSREKIDWSECSLVEINPGVQSGAPVLRGTRMPAYAIVDNFDYGVSVSEIAEQFELSPESVKAIVSYAQSRRVAHPVR
jgi:uncharacterized protein (DUF433 family)